MVAQVPHEGEQNWEARGVRGDPRPRPQALAQIRTNLQISQPDLTSRQGCGLLQPAAGAGLWVFRCLQALPSVTNLIRSGRVETEGQTAEKGPGEPSPSLQ